MDRKSLKSLAILLLLYYSSVLAFGAQAYTLLVFCLLPSFTYLRNRAVGVQAAPPKSILIYHGALGLALAGHYALLVLLDMQGVSWLIVTALYFFLLAGAVYAKCIAKTLVPLARRLALDQALVILVLLVPFILLLLRFKIMFWFDENAVIQQRMGDLCLVDSAQTILRISPYVILYLASFEAFRRAPLLGRWWQSLLITAVIMVAWVLLIRMGLSPLAGLPELSYMPQWLPGIDAHYCSGPGYLLLR